MEFAPEQLPQGLSKTLNDLARTREKSAKHKYLLDLAESLAIHISAFLLAEYKECGVVHVDLEKDFLKKNKNLGFGVYIGFTRAAANFLHTIGKDSKIHDLLLLDKDFPEYIRFTKAYEGIKEVIDTQKNLSLKEAADKKAKEGGSKTNILKFFDKFVELRNRVAHPHKEVKGLHITWPFDEDYFDSINPYMEQALFRMISSLNNVWEFKTFTIQDADEDTLTLESEQGELTEIANKKGLEKGVRVVLSPEQNILLFDWKLLLKAGNEAIEAIRKEEEELRAKASVSELKEAIKGALEDEQISREELNFFESLGKTKLNLNKADIKQIILEVAKSQGIEDPFPEVDRRFIEVVDQAIVSRTYNEFLLKLTGQQYGVDNEAFDKVFLERTFALNVDPDDVRKNKVLQFSREELNAFQGLMRAQQWLMNISLFNRLNKGQYKITGDRLTFGTKEYFHRNAFHAVEEFVQTRIKKLVLDDENNWETNQNNWQIGVMTSYAWCAIYPKNYRTGRILALNLSMHSDGYSMTGFLPDWKDYRTIESYGLILQVFVNHLKDFCVEYRDDIQQYPNLKVWDSLNNIGWLSLSELSQHHEWYLDHAYGFDMIQFGAYYKELESNPFLISEYFDIAFNLFNGLFEGVNRDYANMLDGQYLIETKESKIREIMVGLNPLFERFGMQEVAAEETKPETSEEETAPVVETVEETKTNDGLKGSVKSGYIAREFREKTKGYPLVLSVRIRQDYYTNQLRLIILVSTAGTLENEIHAKTEKALQAMADFSFEGAEVHFVPTKWVLSLPIADIDNFDAEPVMEAFLKEFSHHCAENYAQFLGLKVYNSAIETLIPSLDQQLEQLQGKITGLFSNQIYKQHTLMKGYRYIDYAYSNKKVAHWLGWGLEFVDGQSSVGVIFNIGNTLTGAVLKDQMEKFQAEHPDWNLVTKGSDEEGEAQWIFPRIPAAQLSSSNDWNRNYTAKHAIIDSPKHYWCPKAQDDKQWIQIQFDQPKEVVALKLQGAPHGKNYVKTFTLNYSIDGKNWLKMEEMEGLSSGTETKEIVFPKPIAAKILRLNPISFEGYPGLRMDIKAQDILPAKMELTKMQPVNSAAEIEGAFLNLEKDLTTLKNNLKGFVGF
jgi:hypothetical protein